MSDLDPTLVLEKLRRTFASGVTRPLSWRRQQMDGLVRFVEEREERLVEALSADLGRPSTEATVSELLFVTSEAKVARRNLGRWSKSRRVRGGLAIWPSHARVVPEPLGVVLILGAWNFPLRLTLAPAIAALSAGNAVCIKPAENAPHTAKLIGGELPSFVDSSAVAIVTGDDSVGRCLTELPFDHVFYTGSVGGGRAVMAACARRPTPVTLELGGKCPCYVAGTANLEVAARRIVWGRFLNAGQTCVAPDYLLVDAEAKEPLLSALDREICAQFGDDPRRSDDFGRIINRGQVERLRGLLSVGEIRTGGIVDPDDRYVSPTVLTGVPDDAPVMTDEVFGPILPVRSVEDRKEAIEFIANRPPPLAIYHFGGGRSAHREFLKATRSGAVVRDDVVVQMTASGLPFGGVGESGFGSYHGRHGFEALSQRRASLERSCWPDPSLRYPPYDDRKRSWLRRLLG